MKISFTKMQGAGNDFIVLDETRERLALTPAHYRRLADRRFGVGADQILSVRPAPNAKVDFAYAIHNADGSEVEHCGNGARCFVRFVREHGLSEKTSIRVQTLERVLTLTENADQTVTVDMGTPIFEAAKIPYLAPPTSSPTDAPVAWQAVLSMGNPHAVCLVADVDSAPVTTLGPTIQSHPAFPQGVNVGFMQVMDRAQIALRVYERGSGETLACGTGACAAVVAGIELGLLDSDVKVHARGGDLRVVWKGAGQAVFLTGPAVTVFQGTIDLLDE